MTPMLRRTFPGSWGNAVLSGDDAVRSVTLSTCSSSTLSVLRDKNLANEGLSESAREAG